MYQEAKVAVLGVGGVGKSAICTRFSMGIFTEKYDPCGMCDSFAKVLRLPSGAEIRVDLLDTAGTEQFTAMLGLYLKQSTHAMLVFSITSLGSLADLVPLYWDSLLHFNPTIKKILVGNKTDLGDLRVVSQEQGLALAARFGCEYVETCAKSGEGIEEAVMKLIDNSIPPFIGKPFKSHILDDLEAIFNDPALSDLKVLAENECIYLHKSIVCARFSTFMEFFNKDGEFRAKNVPYEHLRVLTKWIYTGKFSPTHPEALRTSIVALNMFPLIPLLDQPQTDTPPKSISFSIFFNEPTLSDIQIVVANKTFFAHKAILACRCKYFKTMFTSGFKESNAETLKLSDISAHIWEEMLRYIYNDQMNVDQVNWQELLMAGFKYNIPGVVDQVGKFLVEQMNWENVVEVYKICLEFPSMDYLLDKVKYVVGYYHPLVVQTQAFKKLEKEKQDVLNLMKVPGNWDYPKVVKKENCNLQ